MIRLIGALGACVLLAVAFAAAAAPRGTAGSWTASLLENGSGRLQFSLDADGDGNMGMSFDRRDFTGLESVDVESRERVPVRFEMRRQAGTLVFEGTFRGGRGSGDYAFEPNPEFPRMLERVGVAFEARPGAEGPELLSLALMDVTIEFIRSMQMIGYDVPLEKYVAFRIFHIDPEYVGAMEAVGYPDLSADKLIETRVHDVSPEYIRRMRADGRNLTLDEYVQSRIFQVTPEFAEEMRRVGYGDVDHQTLVQFRIHGVSADFVRKLRTLGYDDVAAEQLVTMRIHGVTPEFIRRVEAAGYRRVPIEKLVQMRIFDIDPEMVGALDDDGR